MKKLLTLLVAAMMTVACCFGLTACGGNGNGDTNVGEITIPAAKSATANFIDIADDFKIGVICLHGESSTYDKNFIDAVKAAVISMGLDVEQNLIIYTDVPEGGECATKAQTLVGLGCKAIFADSFGHEDYLIQVATNNPDVQFFHATGTKAHTAGLSNFHNAFASIYEGRYLAGVAAGLKLKEMDEKGLIKDNNKDANGNVKVGYVGAWTYAEVISGFTSWYLGVKSQYPNVVMDVQFTGSWYDEAGEKSAAQTLISRGCALISQHADSMGAPNACETAGVPNVSYNGSTYTSCPDTFLISSKIDWTYYFQWIIASVGGNAKAIPTDFSGTISNGAMVALTAINGNVMANGTVEKLVEVRNQLLNGTLKVFDCSKFTVTVRAAGTNGEGDFGLNANATVDANGHLTAYMADVNSDPAYTPDTQVVKTEGGVTYFAESEFRSAPYFDIQIDGITYLNTAY